MPNNQQLNVRKAKRSDLSEVLGLIRELAVYEKAENEVTITLEELAEDGFGTNAIYGLFVAEMAGKIIGIAPYCEKYSTWKGRSLFLEDIVVTENMRGRGVGHRLFETVISEAKKRNSARLEWQVLGWNEPAINFYKKYNANLDGEWLNGKLTREQIQSY
ncbi:MAG: GNAT family N-acetyltransferase [Flavobacteriales bacterium]|nr:GNAT family N-acetyltransferase [Flavobacteriales bacterium]